jgi:alpha-tubulin suppressor-like RCC1 family protein/Leucine-rich repeat (LRR) protein
MTNADFCAGVRARAIQTPHDMPNACATRWMQIARRGARAAAVLLMAALSLASLPASAVSPAERQALINLYNSTNGASWTTSTNWNGGTGTECSWFGVQCSMVTTGDVIKVDLNGNNLTGTLPDLSPLNKIQVLELNNNHIGGTIQSLTPFTEIDTIDLSGNQFTGSIPPLSAVTSLVLVSFADNHLTGSIPNLTGMASLSGFDVSDNQLTGSIPSLSGLTNLVGFSVKSNALTGSLPSLTGLSLLTIFFADQNQLTGSIPDLSGLTSLVQFHVFSNQLTGSVPSVAGLTALIEFAAYDNQLNGTIGSLAGATNLSLYLLYQNQLTGSIPPLAGLTNLQFFQVENNQLTGTLPSLSGLTNLLFFQADSNQITGGIPTLTGLSNLIRFTASNNQLTGTIPSFAGLGELRFFLVYKNQLTGTFPSLTGADNLVDIEIAENLMTGTLPAAISAHPHLQQLIVAGNQFSGPIPAPPSQVVANGSDLRYNALVPNGNATDTAVWNAAQDRGNDWQATQTVAPGGVSALASGTAVTVSWTPIAYTGDTGAYEVYKSTTPGGPYTLAVSTANKSASSASVPGLSAMTTYYFVVATRTDAHSINPDPQFTNNASILRSANSAEVSATTTNPLSSTTTTLTSSGSPSSLGTAVTFTATVTGGTNPTGNVIFRDASSIFATMPLQLVGANYQATYTIANLATGTHPFTAEYVGDASNAGSTSAVLNQVVGPAATTFSGTTATGTGAASASFTGGGSNCGFEGNQTAFVVAPPSLPVPGATLPHGQFKFKLVNCDKISTIHMSITWPSLAGMTYYKYGPINVSSGNSVWYQPDNLVITGNTANYDITDGFNGDDDLLINGEIVDPSGPVVVPAGPPGTSVSSEISNTFAGSTCSRTATNGFKCWGLNSNKELGDNTTTPHTSPVDVQNVPANTAVIQGVRNGTCLFSNTGALKCFGYNGDGEIGNNTQGASVGTPTDVIGLSSGVAQVGSTSFSRCALTTVGGVKCWGRDLDQSTIVFHLTPVDVPGLTSGVIQIAGGYDFFCALTVSGGVKCWGANSRNQLGDGTNMDRFTPGDVTGLTSGVALIATGAQHACAVLTTGGLKCWGYNSNGQVGDGGSTATNRPTPVDVSGLTSGVVGVAGGFSHTCALLASGAVNCWGFNLFGQVGDASFTQRLTPVQVSGLTSGYVAIVGGANISCAQSSNGAVKCWGNDDSSNGLGDGTNNTSAVPVNVVGLGGGNHVLSAFTPPASPSFPLTRGVGQSLTLSATSSAGLPVTFSTYTPDRCTVTGNQVHFNAIGLCFVRASSAANGTFSEASDLTREILVTAGGPAISLNPTTLPSGVVGTPYSQNVTAIGGLGPYTFTVPPGTLPTGLTLSSFGALTGTPTANGSFTFTVTATDSTNATGAQAYTIVTGGGPTITISPATLPSGAVGTAYSQTLTASGGTGPYTFTVPPNTLPTGLSLDPSGALTGTPTANGSFTFTVTATDSTSAAGTQSYTVVIGAGPTITISPATLPSGTVGVSYSQTLTASGGTGPYTFTVPANTLPTGLSLGVSGGITGMPTANGSFTFTVTATDANTAAGTRTYTVVIAAVTRTLTVARTGTGAGTVTSAPPGIQCGVTCSASFADGASVTLTAVASAGSTFVGWSGACSGAGGCVVTMTTAQSVTAQFDALPVPLSLPPATLPVGALNVTYLFTFAAVGGTPPYSYALTSGALPPGLGLNSATGALSGIPTQVGTFAFQITVTDAVSATASQNYSVTVSAIVAPIPTASNGTLWAMMLLTLAVGVVMLRRRSE